MHVGSYRITVYALLNPAEDYAIFDTNINLFLYGQVPTATVPGMDGCAGMTRQLGFCPISTARIISQTLIQQVEYLFSFCICMKLLEFSRFCKEKQI